VAAVSLRRRLCLFRLLAYGLLVGSAIAPTAGATTRTIEYRIVHPVVGDIGYYRNIITTFGDAVTVQSTLRVVAELLGVVVHREDADRTETWKAGRLVRFDGVTTANGRVIPLHGEAQGDKFVLTTPRGVHEGPADIRPSNPIDGSFVGHDTMMDTDTGLIHKIKVFDKGEVTVEVLGRPMEARYYDAYGQDGGHSQVWVNDLGVPIQFITYVRGTDILFRFTSIVDKP
jgi:hypothetical protein